MLLLGHPLAYQRGHFIWFSIILEQGFFWSSLSIESLPTFTRKKKKSGNWHTFFRRNPSVCAVFCPHGSLSPPGMGSPLLPSLHLGVMGRGAPEFPGYPSVCFLGGTRSSNCRASALFPGRP